MLKLFKDNELHLQTQDSLDVWLEFKLQSSVRFGAKCDVPVVSKPVHMKTRLGAQFEYMKQYKQPENH